MLPRDHGELRGRRGVVSGPRILAKSATERSLSNWSFSVIIVSEPSAEATRPVSTGRYIPVRSRSSAAHNDTPRYADVRRIRVHTEEVTGSIPVSPTSTVTFYGA
jgi:hypothetical protein